MLIPTVDPRRLRRSAAALAASAWLSVLPAQAHTLNDGEVPYTNATLRWRLNAVASHLHAGAALPTQALPGYLLLGDPGVDRQGLQLEHGTAALGVRVNSRWSGALALGKHGSDPVHTELAWLSAQGDVDSAWFWTWGLGRGSPVQGAVIAQAGHLDRFGSMPLAKHAVTNGDWTEDGSSLGLQRRWGGIDWRADAGLWSGQRFPGSGSGGVFPSLNVGASWHGDAGEFALDVHGAWLRPAGRGSRLNSSTGAHSHAEPVCDANLTEVVCLDGRSRVGGLGASWAAADDAWSLSAALLWRDERGQLQSANGSADYRGQTRGDWLQAEWQATPSGRLAWRHERLQAQHTLVGAGANLVASEAGFGAYAPARRSALAWAQTLSPWATLHLEAGRERAGAAGSVRFAAARLQWQWQRDVRHAAP